MSQPPRPAPLFIADDSALDFLNSRATPLRRQIEWLRDGSDLLDWLGQTDLVPAIVLARFQPEADMGQLDEMTDQARQLREWFREFITKHAGQPLPAAALAALKPLNTLMAADVTYTQIDHKASSERASGEASPELGWRRERRWHSPDTLLLPIAEAMGDTICQADFTRVRNCEGSTCTMWFYDISKNRTRRWCDMSTCGNRAKATLHRAKTRSAVS